MICIYFWQQTTDAINVKNWLYKSGWMGVLLLLYYLWLLLPISRCCVSVIVCCQVLLKNCLFDILIADAFRPHIDAVCKSTFIRFKTKDYCSTREKQQSNWKADKTTQSRLQEFSPLKLHVFLCANSEFRFQFHFYSFCKHFMCEFSMIENYHRLKSEPTNQ